MTLDEMAKEYRLTAAKLHMAIQQHKKAGDMPKYEIDIMCRMLNDVRQVLRTISGYYELPRPGELDSSSWHGSRINYEKS